MVVTLIIACEVGFWLLLAGGLALRYLARMPRLGAAVLLCEPALELLLLVVTAIDIKNGAAPSWTHGLAALYLGYTVAYGRYTVRWLDAHAAYRFGGGPKPPGAGYGKARAVHEWKLWTRTLLAAAVAIGLLQAAIWYVGADGDVSQLETMRYVALRVVGGHAIACVCYTIWPKKPPKAADRPLPSQEQPAPVTRTGA
ncbi:hypothetical protein [Streptomyces antimicrobicus]|uniref:Integral membrane protein n=1 Tax=Streptomyces antimicrobicus TaxID=2883108 RepID=A0ABS8AZT9_9ACTN|nr:hypothetical protein [Streptomyces antimicrobicus]MCB5177835.1 hypothetical protein [Streptomyces antimicrobicus]